MIKKKIVKILNLKPINSRLFLNLNRYKNYKFKINSIKNLNNLKKNKIIFVNFFYFFNKSFLNYLLNSKFNYFYKNTIIFINFYKKYNIKLHKTINMNQ